MIVYIVTAVVVIALMIFVLKALWSVSAMLVIPVQIVLFIILSFLVFKIFFTKENVKKLNHEIDKSGIVQASTDSLKKTVKNKVNELKKAEKNDSKQPETPQVRPRKQGPVREQEIAKPSKGPAVSGQDAARTARSEQTAVRQPAAPERVAVRQPAAPERVAVRQPAAPERIEKKTKKTSSGDDFFKMDVDSSF